ncbi:MAG: hypothetical protein J7M29_02715 [Verrucomicrobia bacterium]|nr:hypothetical protein [Verrucomicrobiota bacterium]
MGRAGFIRTPGRVIETAGERTVKVELPNGFVLYAKIQARDREKVGPLAPGDAVTLEVATSDPAKGFVIERKRL